MVVACTIERRTATAQRERHTPQRCGASRNLLPPRSAGAVRFGAMRRGGRNILVVGAVVAMTLSLVSWVRSYFAYDHAYVHTVDPTADPTHWWAVVSCDGALVVLRMGRRLDPRPNAPWFGVETYAPGPGLLKSTERLFRGFDSGIKFGRTFPSWDASFKGNVITHYWAIPYWFLTLLPGTLALFIPWLIRRIRFRRLGPTQCRSCGYDLRGGHERCPECGGESHVPTMTVSES